MSSAGRRVDLGSPEFIQKLLASDQEASDQEVYVGYAVARAIEADLLELRDDGTLRPGPVLLDEATKSVVEEVHAELVAAGRLEDLGDGKYRKTDPWVDSADDAGEE